MSGQVQATVLKVAKVLILVVMEYTQWEQNSFATTEYE